MSGPFSGPCEIITTIQKPDNYSNSEQKYW